MGRRCHTCLLPIPVLGGCRADLGSGSGSAKGFADDAALPDELLQTARDERYLYAEDLRCLRDQLLLREVAVPLVARLREGELEAGLRALGAVVGDAQTLRDLVSRLEADAPDLSGEAVRLVLDDSDRGVAVGLVDTHGQAGGNANPREKNHHLFDGLLLRPGPCDHLCAFGTEAGHLTQALGFLLDDAQRVHVEVGDDALGHLGADALDKARTQVAAYALDGSGQHGGEVLD